MSDVKINVNRSSGRKGPSQPKKQQKNKPLSTVALPPGFVVTKQGISMKNVPTRKSKRGTRRRNENNRNLWQTGVNGGLTLPMSVCSTNLRQYMRRVGSPKHKEWGQGIRYEGVSVLGTMNFVAGDAQILTPSVNRMDDISGTSSYTDLNAISFSYANTIFSLHPFFVPRLESECFNNGRYCYRSCRVWSRALAPTDSTNNIAAAIIHDTSLPFSRGYLDGVSAFDVVALDNSISCNAYQSFSIDMDDYTGDKTYSCSVPTVSALEGNPPGGYGIYGDWANDYYQYDLLIRTSSTGANSGAFGGYLMMSYTIDFYEFKETNSVYLTPYVAPNTDELSLSALSTLPRTPMPSVSASIPKPKIVDLRRKAEEYRRSLTVTGPLSDFKKLEIKERGDDSKDSKKIELPEKSSMVCQCSLLSGKRCIECQKKKDYYEEFLRKTARDPLSRFDKTVTDGL